MSRTSEGRVSVLIPCGRKMKSYACMRSLNRRGIHTIVASEYERDPHFSSRYCAERAHLPAPPSDLSGYRDALLELARRPDVETIIPVRECDVYLFAKYEAEFESHVSLVTPDLETLGKGHDRLQLAREAARAGVPHAETRLLADVDEWNADAVVKSRYNILTSDYLDSYPTHGVEEVKNVTFLPAGVEPNASALRAEMKHDPIVQEFIPQADKHLYGALWEDGEPLATYQHRQVRQNSWVGGGGVYRVSAYSPTVEEHAYDLLSRLEWTGFACIEYLQDERTGEWKFLELNPRIWQSLPEAVRAGVDFPYYYWLRTTGSQEQFEADYETGVACHNAYGELAHLLSIRHDESPFIEPPSFGKSLWEIASSCVTNPRFEYIRLDDPQFFLSAVRETFSSGITRSRQFSSGDVEPRATASTDGGTGNR